MEETSKPNSEQTCPHSSKSINIFTNSKCPIDANKKQGIYTEQSTHTAISPNNLPDVQNIEKPHEVCKMKKNKNKK